MYAAKDNMNLPVKKTRTPLPSSPTPNFPSPAGPKRHNGEGTEVSPTDLLVDRDKRSPQNDPRIMDHLGSQNKAQQIIEFTSSNIEHSGKATAAAAMEQRFIVSNAVTPLLALPNPSIDREVELNLETLPKQGNRCTSMEEGEVFSSSFQLVELPEALEAMEFPINIESKTKLPLARMREETQVNGEVGEAATASFGADDKGRKRKKAKKSWQCPACRKPCSSGDELKNHIIEKEGCQLEILKQKSNLSCFASIPSKKIRKSSTGARMKFGQTSTEHAETYINRDRHRKEVRHQTPIPVALVAREENKLLTYSQNNQTSVAASISLTTPGNRFTWPLENAKQLKNGYHTSKEVSCPECGKIFPGESELPPHRGKTGQCLPFKCICRVDDTRICPLAYEAQKQLDGHVSMLHPAEHAASVVLKSRQAEFIEAQALFRRRQAEFIASQALLALGSRTAASAEVYSDEHADEGMLTD